MDQKRNSEDAVNASEEIKTYIHLMKSNDSESFQLGVDMFLSKIFESYCITEYKIENYYRQKELSVMGEFSRWLQDVSLTKTWMLLEKSEISFSVSCYHSENLFNIKKYIKH